MTGRNSYISSVVFILYTYYTVSAENSQQKKKKNKSIAKILCRRNTKTDFTLKKMC